MNVSKIGDIYQHGFTHMCKWDHTYQLRRCTSILDGLIEHLRIISFTDYIIQECLDFFMYAFCCRDSMLTLHVSCVCLRLRTRGIGITDVLV